MNTFQKVYSILYRLKFELTRDGHHIGTFKDDSIPVNVKTLVADLNQICCDIVGGMKSSDDDSYVFSGGWRDFGRQFGDWLQLEHPYDSDWIYGLLETSGVLEFVIRETAKDLMWQAKARPIDPVMQAILDNTDPELKADVMARAGLSIPPPQKLSEKFPRAFGISTFGACHMSYSPLSKEIFIPTDHDTRYGGTFKYKLAPSRSRDVLDLMHCIYETAVAHDNQHEQEKGLLFIFENKLEEIERFNKECLAKFDAACGQDGEILKKEIIGYLAETDRVINDAKLFLSNTRDFLQKKSDLEEWFWKKAGTPKQGQVLESLKAADLSTRIKALEKAKGIDSSKSIRSQVLEKQDALSLSLHRSSSAIQTIIERLPPESFFKRIGSAIVKAFSDFINWLHSFMSVASTMETAVENAERDQNSADNIRIMPYKRKRRASFVSALDALKEADGLLFTSGNRKRRRLLPQAEQVEAVQLKGLQVEAGAKIATHVAVQAG